jgi:hypothetical protein
MFDLGFFTRTFRRGCRGGFTLSPRIIISIMYYKMTIETCLMLSNEYLTFFVVWM